MPRPTKRANHISWCSARGKVNRSTRTFEKRIQRCCVHQAAKLRRAFEEADSKFQKDKAYQGYAEVTDEIWFFLMWKQRILAHGMPA